MKVFKKWFMSKNLKKKRGYDNPVGKDPLGDTPWGPIGLALSWAVYPANPHPPGVHLQPEGTSASKVIHQLHLELYHLILLRPLSNLGAGILPESILTLESPNRWHLPATFPGFFPELRRCAHLAMKLEKWKWKSLSRVRLFATPRTMQYMEFSRPEYWSG